MNDKNNIITTVDIRNRIFTVRGVSVMIDSDLAEMYGVETKNLNLAVKRNIERFPNKFKFQLTQTEFDEYENSLRLQIETSNNSSLRLQNETLIYHFGASLKDLGKKWFAFSKMEITAMEMIAEL